VFNKIDMLSTDRLEQLRDSWPEAVFVSALKKVNLELLKEKIYDALYADMTEVIFKFPFARMGVVNSVHKYCEVLKQNYQDNEAVYWVRVKKPMLDLFRKLGVEIREI
jgi:GTP-binding protein HflX